MPIMKKLFNNTRKPVGFLGKMMVRGMNSGHAAVTQWGLSCLPSSGSFQSIADLGCGGGKAVKSLLTRFPEAKLTGLDYSDISVETARKENRKSIAEGRCQIIQGDVSALPFAEESFDLVTAFETIYFWPGPDVSFQQVLRVLKPGGIFMIVCESDGEKADDEKWLNMIDGMRVYKKDQLEQILLGCGFSSVEIHHNLQKHNLCLLAKK